MHNNQLNLGVDESYIDIPSLHEIIKWIITQELFLETEVTWLHIYADETKNAHFRRHVNININKHKCLLHVLENILYLRKNKEYKDWVLK